jgi:prepilin signal peptidase PulO-like enzyme (type II secretory pathway)
LNILLPILLGIAGTVAGWIAYRIVGLYSQRQFAIEQHLTLGASTLFWLSLAVKFGEIPLWILIYGCFGTVLIAVALFDFRTQRIPLQVAVPGTIAGPILAAYTLPIGVAGSLAGLLFGGGVLIVTTFIEAARKKEVGGGDWKYAAMIGSFVGWPGILTALIFTGVFGVAAAVALKAQGIDSRPQALGPWLSAGALVSVLLG